VSPLEARMSHLEGAYEQVGQRLAAIDLRFDGVDRRFDAIDRHFGAVDQKIELLRSSLLDKIDQRFMWTIGVILSTWLATFLAIFFHR